MKKILSLILALLMIVSCASFIFADENDAAEVKESDSKYYDAVQFLVNYDIMHGKGDKLGVYDNIKRYEMALFIGRICTGWVADDQWEDGTEDKSGFVDLAGTAAESFYGAISYVAQKGVIVGVGGNKFAPEAGIKYEDALTMAVRALGYNDLAYPWGYIDKAVNLGLTAGIEGVAYSETLKREVVAQIVYNALFAATAEGDTLAKRNFNLDLNYETIMITAADGGHYVAGAENAPEGYVAYQVVEADGTLNSQVYFETAASFGFTDEHDDERALGTLYKAVFNKNNSNGLGTIVSAESIELDTVWNLGLNSTEAGSYPIAKYLAGKTLVSKYSFTAQYAKQDQFILVRDDNGAITTIDNIVAIDWYTGNILVKDSQGVYRVEWYYNQLLKTYYRYKTDVKDNGDITLVATEMLTDVEIAKLYGMASGDFKDVRSDKYCYDTVADKEKKDLGKTAYASLRIFEGENYGIYDEYRLGYFKKNLKVLDISQLTDKNVQDSYDTIIANRNSWFKDYSDEEFETKIAHPKFVKTAEQYVDDGIEIYDYSDVLNGKEPTAALPFAALQTVDVKGVRPGEAAFGNDGLTAWGKIVKFGTRIGDVWFTDGVEPEEGWVIYGTNLSTNEVTIVKTIGEYTEGVDSYVATGVLRAFNMTKNTLTIGDETFSTDYNALAGTAFSTTNYKDGYWWAGTQYVSSLLSQFVTYVVVDGKVAYIEACGSEDFRFLVVDSYAGIDRNDGTIVINAWDTADGKNSQFRIAHLDGNRFGDLFYYGSNYKNEAAELFTRGTVLQILSYNAETDAYGVTALRGIKTTNGSLGKTSFPLWFDEDGKLVGDEKGEKGVTQRNVNIKTAAGLAYAEAYQTFNKYAYSLKNTFGAVSAQFTWFEFDFALAKFGIRQQAYLGTWRDEPNDWMNLNDIDDTGAEGAAASYFSASASNMQILPKKNMSDDDKYILIFAEGELPGSPIRIFTGKDMDPKWYIKGWRLLGTDSKTHIFMGLKAENVNGFNLDKGVTNTAVIMIDYNGIDSDGKTFAWRLPELHTNCASYQTIFGGNESRYDPSKGGNPSPWGYTVDASYDDGNLLGNTQYSVTVLDLRTLKTITVKSNKRVEWNYIYEVQDGKIVGNKRNANELFDMLNGMFVHDPVDIVNDTVIGRATDVSWDEMNNNQRDKFGALGLNQWMTQNYFGVSLVYFGENTYTVSRKSKRATLVTVHEAKDGHAELATFTENGSEVFAESATGAKITADRAAYLTSMWVGDELVDATSFKVISLVNMDAVKRGTNYNPHDGQMIVSYLFNANAIAD